MYHKFSQQLFKTHLNRFNGQIQTEMKYNLLYRFHHSVDGQPGLEGNRRLLESGRQALKRNVLRLMVLRQPDDVSVLELKEAF
jgi:hypothetical protein